MATTTTMGTRDLRTSNTTWYWVVGAVVLVALIVFFSMSRDTTREAEMTAPATMSAPATVTTPSGTTSVPGVGTGTTESVMESETAPSVAPESAPARDAATDMNRESGVRDE